VSNELGSGQAQVWPAIAQNLVRMEGTRPLKVRPEEISDGITIIRL